MPHDHDLCNTTTNFSTTCKFIFSHPLYIFYFIFFSPYFFKFFFFISSSPLFLTTSLLVFLSVFATSLPHHSNLGFLDRIQLKLNEGDVVGEDDDDEFEDFEIYKIVFRDPPLLIMEEDNTVAESEKERRLERLFEELDRFEDSTAEQDLENVMLTSAANGDGPEQVKVTSSVSMADNEMKQDLEKVMLTSEVSGDELEQVKLTSSNSSSLTVKSDSTAEIEKVVVTSAISGKGFPQLKVTSAISTEKKSDLENVGGELQESETVMMTSSFSGDDQLTGHSPFTEKSNSSRFDSSSSFGSYESTEDSTTEIEMNAQSDHEEFEKLQPVTSSISGENQLLFRRLNDSPVKVVKKVTSSNSVMDNETVNNLLQVDSSSSFGSYGSMRKEKEWKRTLACKLFEERRNLEGGEEVMDSLWESYETDNSSQKTQLKLTNKNKINKKSEFKYFDDGENEEDDDEEDEFMSNGQLCCLKALKLSTGKMNLGMGKPNLVKISKALKGFGWLHRVGSKHGKKK